ncbi:MAG TPA: MFS transporter, partial [Leifsonia sp.]|nr:MFS transporter [Leifsonia sp.]
FWAKPKPPAWGPNAVPAGAAAGVAGAAATHGSHAAPVPVDAVQHGSHAADVAPATDLAPNEVPPHGLHTAPVD